MHEHYIENANGELVAVVKLCSNACDRDWCEENDKPYAGWNGCHETELTDWCAYCGVVLPGTTETMNSGEPTQPCSHQRENVVVNRIFREEGEKCEHGNWIQLPGALTLIGRGTI